MKTKKNILIVCEGSNTEPEYFHQLRDDLIRRGVDYSITIKPKPPTQALAELQALQEANPAARPGGRRRQVTDVEVPVEEFMVEETFLAQPTRYVREAQLGLIDDTYEEAWAVYDQDGHPQHQQAVALAVGDPNHLVHIGFSSIAFEHWLLLHFELSNSAFQRSECRHQNEVFNCGQNIHPLDCHGTNCVSGYMKVQGYIPSIKNIKKVGYDDLSVRTNEALTRAYTLRRNQIAANPNVPIYDINPIVTVDRLVLKLLKEPFDLVWKYALPVILRHIHFTILKNGNELLVNIQNTGKAGFIFDTGSFILLDVLGNTIQIFERFVAEAHATMIKTLDFENLNGFEPAYIGFKMEENRYAIIEI